MCVCISFSFYYTLSLYLYFSFVSVYVCVSLLYVCLLTLYCLGHVYEHYKYICLLLSFSFHFFLLSLKLSYVTFGFFNACVYVKDKGLCVFTWVYSPWRSCVSCMLYSCRIFKFEVDFYLLHYSLCSYCQQAAKSTMKEKCIVTGTKCFADATHFIVATTKYFLTSSLAHIR